MFIPSHIGAVPSIDFGLVFDVPRLRQALQVPILEWHEVKERNSQELEELGCWNTWEAVQDREAFPRGSSVVNLLNLGEKTPHELLVTLLMIYHRPIVHQGPHMDQGYPPLRARSTQFLLGSRSTRLPRDPRRQPRPTLAFSSAQRVTAA